MCVTCATQQPRSLDQLCVAPPRFRQHRLQLRQRIAAVVARVQAEPEQRLCDARERADAQHISEAAVCVVCSGVYRFFGAKWQAEPEQRHRNAREHADAQHICKTAVCEGGSSG